MAEQGIKRRVSDSDVLQVLSDTEFLVCFAKLNRESAVERAKQISREIKQEFFAELPELSTSVTVKQYVAEIELKNLAGDKGSLADRLVLTPRRMRMAADRAILVPVAQAYRKMKILATIARPRRHRTAD